MAGSYIVTVTDGNGCTETATYVVNDGLVPLSVSGTATNNSCYGLSEGLIDVTVSGGVAPYTYLWNDGSVLEDRNSLSAGTYSLTVTDAASTTVTGSWTITQPTALDLSSFLMLEPDCNNGNDGEITVYAAGGTAPYTYLWSTGSTNQYTVNLAADGYSVTVTDANGCTATTTIIVTEPTVISLSGLVTDVTVAGGSDGAVDLTVSGGTTPYTYVWSNATTTEDISGLMAGSYTVIVTDANGCLSSDMFIVSEPPSGYDIQTLTLNQGWSIFSTYIDPTIPSIDSVFVSIASDVIMIKSGVGTVYWPIFGVNMIGNMVIGEGYQIKMDSMLTLDVTGVAVVPELTPISVVAGWSIIGYLRQSDADISLMLASISADLEMAKSGAGTVYWPSFSVNMIGNEIVGEGYQLKMNAADTLLYPANSSSSKVDIYIPETQYFSKPINTGNNMTLGIPNSSWVIFPNIGDEVAVYSPDGLLVGSSVYNGDNMAITIWGDDELSEEVVGMQKGDHFVIKYYNNVTGVENVLEVTGWIDGDNTFTTNAISIVEKIHVKRIHEFSLHVNEFMLMQNTPNPFKDKTTISFYLPIECQATIELYNSMGERIMVLYSGIASGNVETIHELSQLPAGTYYYRLQTPNYNATKSMIIIK